MTIKELGSLDRNMDNYENPQKAPVEELKIKYLSSNSAFDEYLPALDQKWCNKDYVFTLYMPPPCPNIHGEFAMGSKEDWLERINLFIDDMNMMLQLDYHRFWSEVVYNNRALDGLSSFLQNAPPFHMRDQIPKDADIFKILKKAQESVFLVLLRLTRSKESEKTWMKSTTLASILYNNFVISLPQLMEICMIFGTDNFKQVSQLICRVIDIQPKYINDIKRSTPFICEIFFKFEKQLGSVTEGDGEICMISNNKKTLSSEEIVKLIYLMLDISYSLASFLEVCPRAATMFHEQQLEPRIASFYENTIPLLNKHLTAAFNGEETQDEFINYQIKLNLCRHQLITAVHHCLSMCLSTAIENRDSLTEQEVKNMLDSYLNTVGECLSNHVFIRDYNSAFPIQRDLKVMSEICPEIDSSKSDFIVESVLSLYDLPPKPKKTIGSTSVPVDPVQSASSLNHHVSKKYTEDGSRKKVTGVELESLITEVKDILPHLGDGFVAKCLEHFNYLSADVINSILESTLPVSLASLDPDMPIIPSEDIEESNGLPERINVFDNDEFDVMTQDKVDTTRIHRGKRPEKHKNMLDLLDDKSHVNQLRDVYTQLSLIECIENVNYYEDEYDDTYDDLDVPVTNAGETEAVERRAFVIPRVLQQYKKEVEEPTENGEEIDDEDDINEESKADLFIENPADIRARAEQRRQELRGQSSGRSRAAFTRRDVVGKPKGQGQDKDVIISREFKNSHKSSRGNHNRRSMAAKKRRQGMLPS